MAVLLGALLVSSICLSVLGADPTAGFTPQQVTYTIQKPYDLPLSSRYSYNNGVHTMWVYKTDESFESGSPTKPRTELRFTGHDYTTGVWQFEADFYVPSDSTGVCIMQVFGGLSSATALQLRVINGNLARYGGDLDSATIATGIYNQWIHLNVIHDADKKKILIYLNGELKREESNKSNKNHYFKCGVYTQDNASDRVESRWKNIKIWKK